MHISGKHWVVYNQPPAENYSDGLKKVLKLLPTLFSAHFTFHISKMLTFKLRVFFIQH